MTDFKALKPWNHSTYHKQEPTRPAAKGGQMLEQLIKRLKFLTLASWTSHLLTLLLALTKRSSLPELQRSEKLIGHDPHHHHMLCEDDLIEAQLRLIFKAVNEETYLCTSNTDTLFK